MKVAIIGGGFTGLTAAYELIKEGHQVTVFEKEKTLGGLANGFRQPNWDWHLEMAYHHLFTNDTAILHLIKELNLTDKLIIKRPITANYRNNSAREGMSFRNTVTALAQWTQWTKIGLDFDGARTRHADQSAYIKATDSANIIHFDAPIHLLTYPGLTMVDKIRTGMLLAILKINPFWRPLESITAKQLFRALGGSASWRTLWEPLMVGKFGNYSDSVAASWLWARIKKRTSKLYYIEGGFHTLIATLEQTIKQHDGTIRTGITINEITKKNWKLEIVPRSGIALRGRNWKFDNVLLTIPTPIAEKLISSCQLSAVSCQLSSSIPHLHAQTLILETKEPILKNVYWLNITDRSFPFLAVVAHTNMIDKKYYGGHHLTYFGNYLPEGHPYLSMTKKQLLKIFLPYIKRLNPSCQLSAVSCQLFTGLYAQPVHTLHYSSRAPKLETPSPGVFLANMDSIYPWDRGTNYAVELGQRAARAITQSAQ